MDRKILAVYFSGEAVSLAAAGVALFWAAGRLDWWAGWAVLAVWLLWFASVDVVILRTNPGLIRERLSPPPDAKRWDRVILSVARLVQLARYILAGLDLRYGWSAGFPLAAQLAALGVCLLSVALFAWALGSNPFFSQVVRIQSERGHSVAQGGPYRYVRHPGYAAMILFDLALSTLLGSWPAITAGAVCGMLTILRTVLEDRTLQAELPGYKEYARRVPCRLVPGVW